MKIRDGFVSNSSTTSFCICGVAMDRTAAEKLFDVDSVYDIPGKDLEAYAPEYYDTAYVGVSAWRDG